jgi:hypothetical protein
MVMLVTLQEASDHLRRDTDDDDADLTLKILAASRAVINYLKNDMSVYEWELDSAGDRVYMQNSAGDYIIREEVKQAVLIMVGIFYIDRDAREYTDTESGRARLGDMSLPRVVHFLLDPLRKPTCA